MLITTTDTLQGVEIAEYIGLVYAVRQDFTGGTGKIGDRSIAQTMEPLKEALQRAGTEAGADAIIGLRVDFEKGYARATGTAVKLK